MRAREHRAWARVSLGMGPEEFGRLTLGELRELRDAWEDEQRRADLRAGQICVLIAAAHRERSARPLELWDFFPSLERFRPAPPTDEQLEAKIAAAFGV